ncbi:MAG: hypothetical protein H6679_04595 [Epsilonproteobacteria bacterium]|nr:hypothetical protein [Campylobacterota bacterium]
MTHRSFVHALLVAVMCAGTLFAGSDDHTGKTYMATRPDINDLMTEYFTWHKHTHKKDSHHTKFQITPFYKQSQNTRETGGYFGIEKCNIDRCKKTNSIRFDNTRTIVDPDGAAATITPAEGAEIDDRRIIPTNPFAPTSQELRTTLTWKPQHESYGVRLDLMQDIMHPFTGLYFKMSMPLVHVATSMRARTGKNVKGACKTDSCDPCPVACPTPACPVDTDCPCDDSCDLPEQKAKFTQLPLNEWSAHDFFAGRVRNVDPALDASGDPENREMLCPLTHAKIDCRRSALGVADIDLMLGYKVVHKENAHVFISAGITAPTGNKVRGEYLFEPIYGNGRHISFNANVEVSGRLWHNKNGRVDGHLVANYRYLAEKTETRTLSLKCMPFSHYFAIGKLNAPAGTPLFPAANVLTTDLRVKPGSLFDALASLSFCSGGFVVDAGYNMFWKDKESVWLKHWEDDKYALPKAIPGFLTINPLEEDAVELMINRDVLDVEAARTPALFTHTLGGSLGYVFSMCGLHSSVAIGASYEFASSNADLERYTVWGKMGFAF